MPTTLHDYVVATFTVIFLFVVFFAFYKNGWDLIQKEYKFRGDLQGEKIKGNDSPGIDFDWYVLWNGKGRTRCRVDIKATNNGLYLRPSDLVDLVLHSAVLIPWTDVSDEWFEPSIAGVNINALFSKIAGIPDSKDVLLKFSRTPSIRLQMPLFIAEKVKKSAHGRWETHVI